MVQFSNRIAKLMNELFNSEMKSISKNIQLAGLNKEQGKERKEIRAKYKK